MVDRIRVFRVLYKMLHAYRIGSSHWRHERDVHEMRRIDARANAYQSTERKLKCVNQIPPIRIAHLYHICDIAFYTGKASATIMN